jgi:hypothetical protein
MTTNNNSNLNNKKTKIPISITTRDESDDDSSNSEASSNVLKDSPTLSRSSSSLITTIRLRMFQIKKYK